MKQPVGDAAMAVMRLLWGHRASDPCIVTQRSATRGSIRMARASSAATTTSIKLNLPPDASGRGIRDINGYY
eukprot:scaffold323747_cov17-Prasinocladus_malaysianus.AAC.1